MTVATLDELLGPVPDEHLHLERYGYREDLVGERRHYVGRDDNGRAVIGPVRHGKGWLNRLRRRKAKATELPVQEKTMKIVIDGDAIAQAAAQAAKTMQESLKTVDFSKLTAGIQPPPPPQKEPGMFRRITEWCKDTWYDEDWHKGARNTAGTVLMWAFTIASIIVFGKGVLWVLFL